MTDPDRILRAVCDLFGVSLAELRSPRRFARLTPARQAAAYALRWAGIGLVECGALLHRDHTTIVYSVRQAEQRAERDSAYAARLRALAAACGATPEAPARIPAQPMAVTPAMRWALTFWGVAAPRTA